MLDLDRRQGHGSQFQDPVGQTSGANSGPIMVTHSAFSRAKTPPLRLATIGAASFETATPTARNPSPRSLAGADTARLRRCLVMHTTSRNNRPAASEAAPDPATLLAWYDRHRRDL